MKQGPNVGTMLSTLNELETLINNALGSLAEEVEIREGKIPKPQKVDVERLAAKPKTTGTPEAYTPVKKQKLMPENMMYKAPALEEGGDAPVETPTTPMDSQDKDVEAALETALEKLKRFKHTLKVDAKDATQPSLR
tara:strand:- start:2451 stop:2861 length:411 start_codon:yes stop_codon:yes gene_type:complete